MSIKLLQSKLLFLSILVLLFFTACKTEKHEKINPLHGNWKSIGYGKFLVLDSISYTFYDYTKISCLPAQKGDISLLENRMHIKNDTLLISKGTSVYSYVKTNQLPKVCNQKLSEKDINDPEFNFEVYAKTIEEHYAYFEYNNIKWDSLYTVTRQKVTPQTTDVELYQIIEKLIETIHDNHGYIEPTDEVYEAVEKLNTNVEEQEDMPEYGDFQIAQMVSDQYLNEDMTKDTGLVNWGITKANIGYIQLKTMWLFADLNLSKEDIEAKGYVDAYVDAFTKLNEGEYIKKEKAGASKIMDRVMDDLKDTDAIILDIRFNGGGQDAVALEVIKRFNNQTRIIATKKTRVGNRYTKPITITLEASSRPYLKPVYLLTSQQTGSAAEMATIATLSLKHVKRIGAHTQGANSDALEKRLPNGWYFTTSNEMYLGPKGKCYENTGIPVDHKLDYPEDRQTFFRKIANHLEQDQVTILEAIDALDTR